MGFSFCICLMTLITSTSLVYYRDVPWMCWNTQSDLYYVLENGWWIWNRGGKKPTSPTPWSYFSLLDSFDIELPHNERASERERERERERQTDRQSLCVTSISEPRGQGHSVFWVSWPPRSWVQTAEGRCGQRAEEPDKPLWLRTYLFPYLLLLQLTFLQSCYFVVCLQNALWAKLASNVPWVGRGPLWELGKGEGRVGKQWQRHSIIELSVNYPCFVIQLPKAGGETKTEKAS